MCLRGSLHGNSARFQIRFSCCCFRIVQHVPAQRPEENHCILCVAAVGHDSQVTVIDVAQPAQAGECIRRNAVEMPLVGIGQGTPA